jgi:hypothetical protein
MRNDDKPGTKIVVPIHTSPIKPGTLSNILKKAEISREELEGLHFSCFHSIALLHMALETGPVSK